MSQAALSAANHARAAATLHGETPERVTLLGAGARLLALPLRSVACVLTPREVVRLPGAVAPVLGLCNADGRIVTVLDLGLALGMPPVAPDAESRLVVLEHRGLAMALLAGTVRGIVAATLDPAIAADAALPLRGRFRSEHLEGDLLDLESLAARCFGE